MVFNAILHGDKQREAYPERSEMAPSRGETVACLSFVKKLI
jgi:hypothetical protein